MTGTMAGVPEHDANLTLLIESSRKGDRDASGRLFALIYDELKVIARRSRYAGGHGETMQPTALANEAYMVFERRFPIPPSGERESRETFFRTVALAMRTILRDHWRRKNAEKRGGGDKPVALGAHDPAARGTPGSDGDGEMDQLDFLSLDAALDALEQYNERWCDVVMHRYFAGRSIEETAELMGVGVTTIKSDWQLAKAWLRREMEGSGESPV